MSKVSMNKCDDCGRLFPLNPDGIRRYDKHVSVHLAVKKIEGEFPLPEYLSNDQCFIRGKGWRADFEYKIRVATTRLYPESAGKSLSWYFGRIVEDSPFSKIVFRLSSVCSWCGREWNQPWGANNCTHLAGDIREKKAAT